MRGSAHLAFTCSNSIGLTNIIYKVNNKDTRTTSFDVFLVSFMLTLNRFYTLFWCFYCGLYWKHYFVITGIAKKSTFIIIKPNTFNTKTTFPSRTFWKIFSFKMFPKCSLDVPNIAILREHLANIPGILRAGWVLTVLLVYHCLVGLTRFSFFHHHLLIMSVIYLSLVIW